MNSDSPTTPPHHAPAAAIPAWYRCLLACYPATHRARYRAAMEQAFRDQWRDLGEQPTRAARWRFRLRLLLDFVRSCPAEHAHELRAGWASASSARQRAWVLGIGGLLALATFSTTLWVTSLMPRVFLSTARLQIPVSTARALDPFVAQTRMEMVRSEAVLAPVIERLNLNERWSAEYLAGQGRLTTPETVEILRHRIEVRPFRNTAMFEVLVYGQDREEAAQVANAIAESYASVANQLAIPDPGRRVSIVDLAEPGLRPIKPNVPLNVTVGLVGALGIGLVSGFITWLAIRCRPSISLGAGTPLA